MNDIEMTLEAHRTSLLAIVKAMEALSEWIPAVESRLGAMAERIDTLEALVEVLMIGK